MWEGKLGLWGYEKKEVVVNPMKSFPILKARLVKRRFDYVSLNGKEEMSLNIYIFIKRFVWNTRMPS